jgi:hypothetical protein
MPTTLPKTFKRKRGVLAHHPRRGRVDARIITSPQRAVYGSSCDRIGSIRPDGNAFAAFGRRGQVLGTFSTVIAAVAAIERTAL